MSEREVERTPGPNDQPGPRTLTSDHDLLVRIYERQRAENDRLDAMGVDIVALRTDLAGLDKRYVTRLEFWPVKAIVYGGAAIILTAVLGSLVALVIISRERVSMIQRDPGHSSALTERF